MLTVSASSRAAESTGGFASASGCAAQPAATTSNATKPRHRLITAQRPRGTPVTAGGS
ncbi:hypothetical protein AB0J83_09625 [Actinoplanes sp. NPDC049596]|uniref:hypothetical protein n=1 Tax=unclassified Actinoplanes TaxID=2626549 RepID=UPI00343A621B